MAKAELGTKRVCPSCAGKFYDLSKSPAECPYCETTFSPDDLVRSRRAPQRAVPEEVPKPAQPKEAKKEKPEEEPEAEAELEGVEVDDVDSEEEDEDDDVLEDASDLGGDDDDVAEVMDNVERPEGGD